MRNSTKLSPRAQSRALQDRLYELVQCCSAAELSIPYFALSEADLQRLREAEVLLALGLKLMSEVAIYPCDRRRAKLKESRLAA